MNWDELKNFLKEKIFLIGITFIDTKGNIIELYQTSGKVYKLTDDGIFEFKRSDNSIFQIPYNRESIKKAESGEYKEKNTGNIILHPDFMTTWEIIVQNEKEIEKIKLHGYVVKK